MLCDNPLRCYRCGFWDGVPTDYLAAYPKLAAVCDTVGALPKLKAYYETRKDKGDCFEYGWCLKAFPDEEIRLVEKEAIQEETGFFKNWLNRITNPMDTEDLKLKGQMTLKQK